MKANTLVSTILFLLTSSLALSIANSDGQVRMANHIPSRKIASAKLLGHLESQEKIMLALPLKLRNEDGLKDFLTRVYDVNDPLYGHYLSTSEFVSKFAPTDADVQAVAAYAESIGLHVAKIHSNNLIVNVEGTPAEIESAFSVRMNSYATVEGRIAYAPTVNPSVRSDVAALLHGVVGLESFTRRHHVRDRVKKLDTNAQAASGNFTGSGVGGTMIPTDIRKAYNLSGLTQTGTGQTMALIELDGYTASDITAYKTAGGLTTTPPLTNVLIDGFDGNPTSTSSDSGAVEVTLDIDMMIAIAPGATGLTVYEAPDDTEAHFIDVFSRAASDNTAKLISNSWGEYEGDVPSSSLNSENTIFQQMASQGQSMFTASGDSGAYDDGDHPTTLAVDDPGSQPLITAVGGTKIALTSAGVYSSESAWGASGDGSGGGFSSFWAMNAYQNYTSMAQNGGSSIKRNMPDVSLNADPSTGYLVIFQGSSYQIGGTSAAAPLWAAYMALVNQARASASLGNIGLANTMLYLIGNSSIGSTCFHDVTAGNNLHYSAISGFDLATGFGSFNGANLLAALSTSSVPPYPPTALTANVTQ